MEAASRNSGRALLVAALVGGGALTVPGAVRAQSITPERALLSRLDPSPGFTTAVTDVPPAAATVAPGEIDGERALLNRLPGAYLVATRPDAVYADGVRALLNRSSR